MKSKFFRILGVVTVVAMLAGTLTVAPALGLSAPNVALTASTGGTAYYISNENIYTITFTAGAKVPVGGKIVIVFPAGTNLGNLALASDVKIQALAGIGGGPRALANVTSYAVTGTYPAAQTLTIVVPDDDGASGFCFGAGSLVGITVGSAANGVMNPATAGAYTLTVQTKDAANVEIEATTTSAAYTIINPVVAVLPGVIKIYNSAGVLMGMVTGTDAIKTAVLALTAEGSTLELGPGTYFETNAGGITLDSTTCDKLTIKASGALADTIVPAWWKINADNVTFKGITFKNETTLSTTIFTINAGATGNTFDGCAFTKAGTATTTAAEIFINYANTTASSTCTIKNCTFDTTLGAVVDNAILVTAGAVGLTISTNTFTVDADATPTDDKAIEADSTVTISGNKFTGSSGIGIYCNPTAAKTITITGNTFDTITRVLYVATVNATVVFNTNTVTGCGLPITTTSTSGTSPILVLATTGVSAAQNKITGCKAFIASIYDTNADLVHLNFNDLSGNTLGILHASTTAHTKHVDATHNWWGAATGPSATQVTYGTVLASGIDTSGYLGAVSTNGTLAGPACNTLAASTTAGVTVDTYKAGAATNVDWIGVASYATNPGAVAPSSTLTVKKYFDVFVTGTATLGVDQILIKFYGTTTANSQVWFYSPLAGAWTKCSNQAANTTSGFVDVILTALTTPTMVDIIGTPFVLVDAPPTAPAGVAVVQSPTLGAINVPVDTTFTWPAVAGATSYEFEIAEEIGQIDKFYLKDASGSSPVSAYKLLEPLKFNKQYWWRVRTVTALGKSDWTTSFFTTAKEVVVVPPTPPVIIKETPAPEITLEIPPAPSPVQPIPSYLLWAVIGVGAVLVIAVIVLIVRTRRIS